jgi:hypothetical protein
MKQKSCVCTYTLEYIYTHRVHKKVYTTYILHTLAELAEHAEHGFLCKNKKKETDSRAASCSGPLQLSADVVQ